MINKLIEFSVKNKLAIALFMAVWIGLGLYSMKNLNVDAVPDITDNQVQVVTVAPSLAPQEVEQFITYPVEQAVANLQGMKKIRSISRYGLSVVTIIFDDNFDIYLARQLVNEAIQNVDIPEEYGKPQMMPITTGLGEIYQYVLEVDPKYQDYYDLTDLRTIQDWIIKRQLAGTKGIVEVSSFGGFVKQYEVAVDPDILNAYDITLDDIVMALERNNQNTGGSYIQQGPYAKYIRAEGIIKDASDIEKIVITTRNGVPVHIGDVAQVRIGHPTRYGAMTKDGKGEAVGGITLMLKGANANKVVAEVKHKMKQIEKTLPPGVHIRPYYDRSQLVDRVIATITENLTIAALIVVFVLVMLLGNIRAGLIVSSVIPLSLLFAFALMNVFGVSASVMSLGAIDFGLIVDGSVIILEGMLFYLHHKYLNKKINQAQADEAAIYSAQMVGKSAAFGVLIILIVYFPIMALQGIEGKMFKPLAMTVSFALLGGLILSLTYVPMMSALFLNKKVKKNFSDKIVDKFQKIGMPGLEFGMNNRLLVLGIVGVLFLSSIFIFTRLGAEFVPSLEEGDLAMQITLPPGSSLNESIKISTQAERILLKKFPEVKSVISKIGTAEVPTDPMALEDADVMIIMKDKSQWTTAKDRFAMADSMKKALSVITGATFDFTQPIQLRFNELLTGAKSDITIKIFGDDLDTLFLYANKIADMIQGIPGAADIKVEQVAGLPQVIFRYDREKLAQYGLSVKDINEVINTALAGKIAGTVFEGEKRFDLVVRMKPEYRKDIQNILKMTVKTPSGEPILLSQIVTPEYKAGPMQISRDNTHRRITIGINVRNRDIKSLVDEIEAKINQNLKLPPGYYITYGGQFENLQQATKRLTIVMPIALLLIFVLLYFTFHSVKQAIIIYSTIPLSIIGGVYSLWIRGLPFSVSAGVGFIALFGVSVLNGIVLMNAFNKFKEQGMGLMERIRHGVFDMIRPISLTTLVAALGFIPMAVSNQAGAEVQRPLATVVIGGILVAAVFTIIVVPILYYYANRGELKKENKNRRNGTSAVAGGIATVILALFMLMPSAVRAQDLNPVPLFHNNDTVHISIEKAKQLVLERNPMHKNALLEIKQTRLNRASTFDLGTTEFSYEHGQLNSAAIDYNATISQNLGNPLEKIALNRYYKAATDLIMQKKVLTDYELEFQVCSAYNNFIYHYKTVDYLKKFVDLYKKGLDIARLRANVGEASEIEAAVMQEKYNSVLWQYQDASLALHIALSKFNTVLFADTVTFIPEIGNLKCQLKKSLLDTADIRQHPELEYYRRRLALEQQNINVEKSKFFPSISVGYFNQQIDLVGGFQGWSVGVSVPLWIFSQKKQVKIAQLNYQIAQNQYEYASNRIFKEYHTLMDQYLKLSQKLDYYENTGLKLAEKIMETSTKLYEAGQIDYVEYLQNLQEAMTIEQAYLSTLNRYNAVVITLNYYTYK